MQYIKRTVLRYVLAASVLPAISISSVGEVIDVTDLQGRSINAKLVDCDEETVQFSRMSDSKMFTLSLSALDEKTRSAIKDWERKGGNLAEKFQVTVNTGKSRRTTAMEDFDDKRVNMKPEVIVKNPNANQATRELKLTVLFLGRPVESRSDIHVFLTQTFDLPKIPPLQSKTFSMKSISQPYDDRGYAKFGSRYYGYVWIIHDDGKAVASASVPAAILGDKVENFLRLEEDRTYGRDLGR